MISSVSLTDDTIRLQCLPANLAKTRLANRERVLDAATELVRRDGEKVPMADIAGRAGVGVGTVYRHFATREALLGALVHRSFGLASRTRVQPRPHPGRRSTACAPS